MTGRARSRTPLRLRLAWPFAARARPSPAMRRCRARVRSRRRDALPQWRAFPFRSRCPTPTRPAGVVPARAASRESGALDPASTRRSADHTDPPSGRRARTNSARGRNWLVSSHDARTEVAECARAMVHETRIEADGRWRVREMQECTEPAGPAHGNMPRLLPERAGAAALPSSPVARDHSTLAIRSVRRLWNVPPATVTSSRLAELPRPGARG